MSKVTSRYVPDNVSFGKFMMSGQVGAPVDAIAEAIAQLAAQLSPYDPNSEGPHLRDGFKVEPSVDVINGSPRMSANVVNSNEAAAANEFGTARTPRHHMLARAGARFGDYKPRGGLNL